MDFYKSSLYIHKLKFPIRDQYLSTIGNYTQRLNKGFCFINNEFSILLKKSKIQEIREEEKKKYLYILKLIEEKKQKKIKSEINRQKRIQLNKKITKSISNNTMLLNIMSNSKQFIKYLNHQKQSRNNNNIYSKNNILEKNNHSLTKMAKSHSNTFMTEIPRFNFVSNKNKKNKINNIKYLKHKIPKFNYNSDLILKKIKEKIINQKYKSMRNKNFSANNMLDSKTVKIPRFNKLKRNLKIYINNAIKPIYNIL